MTTEQPNALRLAKWLDAMPSSGYALTNQAATELRRLHEVNQELLEALKLALGTLLSSAGCHDNPRSVEAIKAIRAAISKGEQA